MNLTQLSYDKLCAVKKAALWRSFVPDSRIAKPNKRLCNQWPLRGQECLAQDISLFRFQRILTIAGAALQLLKLLEKEIKIEMTKDVIWRTPSKVFLLFVRTRGEQKVRNNFSFFAFPNGVDLAYVGNKRGKSGLRNPAFVLNRFRTAAAQTWSESSDVRKLEERLAFKYKSTPLLLPAQGFLDPGRGVPIAKFFESLWDRKARWDDADGYMSPSLFKREDFPQASLKRQRVLAFSNGRTLAFLPAEPQQWHAPPQPPSRTIRWVFCVQS